jgi:hypothetical protein
MIIRLKMNANKEDSLELIEERVASLEKLVGSFKDLEQTQVNDQKINKKLSYKIFLFDLVFKHSQRHFK